MTGTGMYQAHQFAERAGVTVRTLHHYDRLGLLEPSGRTASGYRLYADGDLVRLQQIVTLKFIGFPLNQIRDILNRKSFDLAAALRLQRGIIERKRRQLDLAIQAIAQAEAAVTAHPKHALPHGNRRRKEPGADVEQNGEVFRKIIEVINMQQDSEWTKQYYSEEALANLEERRRQWTPELQQKAQEDWATLIREVEGAIAAGENPASERAQALAARWQGLVASFTGGNPEVAKGLGKLYSDKQNWPANFKKPYSDEVGAFICAAADAKKGR